MSKEIRTAQFGGIGGQSPSWSPGSSPFGKRGMGGGMSVSIHDDGLDAIMGRTRVDNVDFDSEENSLETRLQPFHNFAEEDMIPYELSRKEREKLNVKKQLQRRRKFYEDSIKSIKENSPDYINKHFFPSAEHILPLEALLAKTRVNEEDRESAASDAVIITDKEGKERKASTRTSAPKVSPTSTIFGPYEDDEEPKDPMGAEEVRMHKTPADGYINHTPAIFSQSDFDNYLGKEGDDFLNFVQEETLMDYPGPDQVSINGEADNSTLPSPEVEIGSNTNITMEEKLRRLKDQEALDRLPNDPYRAFNLDKIRNQGKEPQGLADKYVDLGNGMPPLPHL